MGQLNTIITSILNVDFVIKEKIIVLPDYWTGLVHEDSVTAQLTPIGTGTIYVDLVENNSIKIGGTAEEFFYLIQAERKDIDKLTVEY